MASAFRQRRLAIQERLRKDTPREPYLDAPPKEPSLQAEADENREQIAQDNTATNGVSIELDAVSKQFGSKQVLRNIQMSVQPGSFVAIVGQSGCGKSTLLRLLSGLDQASGGSLRLQGQEVQGIHPATRFMFQDSRLLPWNTVLDNVKLGLTGSGSNDPRRRAYEALELVGLADRAEEWPSVLSGGQRQRVALARALVGNPRLLLFDEPLGALDALTRIEMQRLIEHLWKRRGFTAVMVTHDVSEAVALADRVILIEQGEIALDLQITLARPRPRDAGFAHFEQIILDRVLARDDGEPPSPHVPLYDI
ncbi:ATP-binding cassette domain-containing protein [Paenibacillus woosongensis]|uniref:ATP-binding cassette domain-containing protein n=1 Tax=Paenibacillus woosongensis TaxID=307580 RepID=A0A7X2Z739_9BACL|nr:ATP-binding cassette domain-containing protein [Paenibacillus woosongensis]MUG48086.1 ATP-binding cassette domain-containing protein [Paenibacillus woosongensis]